MPLAAPDIATLYASHHGWLHALLRRKLGCAADAADLAQDAFVRLLIKPRAFDGAEGTRAYLSTVARGLCIDLWRRREVEQAWREAVAAHPEVHACSAEHTAMVLQALAQIDAMLGKLSEKAARAFVLATGYGLTDAEIAAQLGVSDRMVRKYVAQAMTRCLLQDDSF